MRKLTENQIVLASHNKGKLKEITLLLCKTAKKILIDDPDLSFDSNRLVKKEYMRAHHSKIQWSDIS